MFYNLKEQLSYMIEGELFLKNIQIGIHICIYIGESKNIKNFTSEVIIPMRE